MVDGDTIRVRPLEATRRRRDTVRLIGIDTPEVYGRVECGGRRASAHLKTGHRPERIVGVLRLHLDALEREADPAAPTTSV